MKIFISLFSPIQILLSELFEDFKSLSLKSDRSKISLKASLACVLALLITWMMHLDDPTWAAVTALVVVQASMGATLVQTFQRIISTLLGVFSALLLLGFCEGNLLLLLGLSLLGLTLCFFCLARSPTPFVWSYWPITFLIILFTSPGMDPTQLTTFAYYRGFEIILGSLCALAVTLVFHTPSAKADLQKNQRHLIKKIQEISEACFNLYLSGEAKKDSPVFKSKLQDLLKLSDLQTVLSRFTQHENIFNPGQKYQSNSEALDHFIFSAQELFAELYGSYHGASEKITRLFKPDIQNLQHAINQTFANFSDPKNTVSLWEQAFLNLMKKAENFRNQQAPYFSIPEMTEWHEFLVRQEEFLALVKDFFSKGVTHHSSGRIQDSPIHPPILTQVFHRDYYYWEYAFKTALFALLLPLFAIDLNLSGAVMLGVVIIVTLQFDLNITQRKLFLLLMGAFVGTGLALILISLNLTNVWLYLSAIFILTFFMGYVLHGPETRIFFGLFTLLTFLSGVTLGMGPIQDWRGSLTLLAELAVAALLLLIILVWIWPFTPAKIFKHSQLQIQWHQDLIKKNLFTTVHSRTEFNALRREIRTFYGLTWRHESFRKKALDLAVLYYRNYHLLAGLALLMRLLDLTQIDQTLKNLLDKILSPCDPETSNSLYLNQLLEDLNQYTQDGRQRFLKGDRLPFCYGVKITHLVSLLKKLAQCQKELSELEH